MKKFNAFTLAEVLITLGIIGVVAAMTMPTLMNQTNGAQYKAAYKKALSAISQAITLNVALEDNSFYEATATGDSGNYTTPNTVAKFLYDRMNVVKVGSNVGYTSTIETVAGVSDGASNTTLFFNDGSVFQFNPSTAVKCHSEDGTIDDLTIAERRACSGFIDVNGTKGPNKVVSDTNYDSSKGTLNADIFPVVIFDQTILPATDIASQVLYGK